MISGKDAHFDRITYDGRELAYYWDEHDFGQSRDVQEVHDMTFRISRKKYVAVDYQLYKEIRRKARLLTLPKAS